jgi:hypothetical protein
MCVCTLLLRIGEAITRKDVENLLAAFKIPASAIRGKKAKDVVPNELARTSEILTHPNFNTYHSETQVSAQHCLFKPTEIQ